MCLCYWLRVLDQLKILDDTSVTTHDFPHERLFRTELWSSVCWTKRFSQLCCSFLFPPCLLIGDQNIIKFIKFKLLFFKPSLLVLLMQPGGRECLIVYSNDTFKRRTKCKWCIYQKHLFITKPMWALRKAFTWCTCIVSDILRALKKEAVYFLISFSMTCLSLTLNGWFTSCYSAPFHWKDQCSERGCTIESLMSKIARAFSLSLRTNSTWERYRQVRKENIPQARNC